MKGDKVIKHLKEYPDSALLCGTWNINHHILELVVCKNFLPGSFSCHRELLPNAVI